MRCKTGQKPLTLDDLCLRAADSVYLLMYGCFILNNDVHSKVLKKGTKMTRERFILNHRGA